MRYDLQAVPTVNQKSQFLAKTSSGRLIMKDLGTGIVLFTENQEKVTQITEEDARELAIWILTQY